MRLITGVLLLEWVQSPGTLYLVKIDNVLNTGIQSAEDFIEKKSNYVRKSLILG
jgi:hypothetical protein